MHQTLVTLAIVIGAAGPRDLPAPIADLLGEDHVLPRYAEQYYHPLGRSPVVDALLADPLYGPAYARAASSRLRAAAASGSIDAVVEAVHRLAAVPPPSPRGGASAVAGDPSEAAIDRAVAGVLEARATVRRALEAIPDEEREWLLSNPGRWFFADDDPTNYRYLTCDTADHLRIFVAAASADVAALASAQRTLAAAADAVLAAHAAGAFDALADRDLPRRIERDGLVIEIAGRGDDVHDEDADLLIDLGGDDWYVNNAGGNRGRRPATLCIDLAGDDWYEGDFAVQGGGFLGVGALVDAAGDDRYTAGDLAQGAAFLGAGLLCDLGGNDRYRARHHAQAAATFGCAVLWEAGGSDEYSASGLSLGCAATQGIGVLVESGGDDRAACGVFRRDRYTADYGMGLGWSAGVRDYPWYDKPAFYGGLGLVDDAGGRDRYETVGGGLGGAYCLGAGVFVAGGDEDDDYFGWTDSLGASIHLGAAVCIEEGGDDRYRGNNSLLGVGGDRGCGVFIDRGGDDRYRTLSHAIGTGRKPKAVGLFLELGGDDRYDFGIDSLTATWVPSNPEDWAFASFLDVAGDDEYRPASAEAGALDRGNGRAWTFGPTGRGADLAAATGDLAERILDALPRRPRAALAWSPDDAGASSAAYRPIVDDTWPAEARSALDALREGGAGDESRDEPTREARAPAPIQPWLDALRTTREYDERRRLYERLDLLRFASGARWDWSAVAQLLEDPADAPEDVLAFAAVWCGLDRTAGATERVAGALVAGEIESAYARQLLVRMVGACGGPRATDVLVDRLTRDEDLLVRRRAAWHLARVGGGGAIGALAAAAGSPDEAVRFSVASGLRDVNAPGALEIVSALGDDESLLVRRAAALAAISMGHKPAVDRLLREMRTRSIDTGENYGRNLFADLAEYVGPDVLDRLGLDLDAWEAWWAEAGAGFDLGAATAAATEYRESRRRPPTSE